MKIRLLSVLALSALLFASCSSDDNEPAIDNGAIRFTSAINQQATPSTRATNTSWAAGDAIGIYMVAPTAANNADNMQHTTTGGNAFAPVAGDEMYYPVNGDNVSLSVQCCTIGHDVCCECGYTNFATGYRPIVEQ